MKITVVGTGFVGVVSSAVYASLGHEVWGLDIDQQKIDLLKAGKAPFYEPGLEDLLHSELASERLTFTTSYEDAVSDSDLIFICTGTPSNEDGTVNLKYVFATADSMAEHLKDGVVIVIKSTVPPGTNEVVKQRLQEKTNKSFELASAPEFLKEGSAVHDTLHPDRVIIGAESDHAFAVLKDLNSPLSENILVMKPESAQMAKYAANAYLATRITFINQIANLCEKNGANIEEVIQGIGEDKRIGSHYWYPGLGYGGSCFPKDVKELASYAKSIGLQENLMIVINDLNESRLPMLIEGFEKAVGGWSGKRVALLGLAFKPNTDDLREAPSTKIVPLLSKKVGSLVGFDPLANEAAKKYFGTDLEIVDSLNQAVQDADVIMILVEWNSFSVLSPSYLLELSSKKPVLIDTRNMLVHKRNEFEKQGISYIGIGV